jgi:tetratricopeptide (TPR) repeat protein
MDKVIMKYNPAFLKPEELVASFVVRHGELETIIQIIKENVTKSNQHVLVVGPRGIGKTILLLRAVEEIRRDKELSPKWYLLVFSEESYSVVTCGEFWLESLLHLTHQTKDKQWQKTYEELLKEKDEKRLRERALAQLMDFADSQGKKILLVVENFNMLLGDQMNDEEAWALRHTLLNEPRVMLLASATSRFEQVEVEGKPMFDLFRFIELKPLNENECSDLWYSLTGQKLNKQRMRPLKILTGGNPRLLAIVSNFAAKMSLKGLMSDLLHLVDEHTEYFKSHLDYLPPIERKVYIALVEIWDPATARQVADVARLEVSKTSALLGRLIERGAVVEANGQGKTKLYQVAERMYNIYYLMRRRTEASWRVRALVPFMIGFYEPKELVGLTLHIAEEACVIDSAYREDHYLLYEAIIATIHTSSRREELINATPRNFFEMPDTPVSTKKLLGKEVATLLRKGYEFEKKGKLKKAEQNYRKASKVGPKYANPWIFLGQLLAEKMGEYDKAEQAFRKAITIRKDYAEAYEQLGIFLFEHFHKNEEAERYIRKAIELEPNNSWRYFIHLGDILCVQDNRYEEAEDAYREAIKLNSKSHLAWEQFGWFLHNKIKHYSEAEQAYRKAIDLKTDCASVWVKLGRLLHKELGRYEEAEKAYRKSIEIEPEADWEYFELGRVLSKLERYNEAEDAFRKAIQIDPKNAQMWAILGRLLHTELGRPEEAEKAYRKAIEIDPAYPCSWFYLGDLLQRRGNYEEAEIAYRTTIEKGLDCHYACYVWENIARLLIEKLGRPTDALQLAEKYLIEHPKDSLMRNSFAWTFYKYGPADLLTKAEMWAEEGLAMEPDKASYQHTIASILCALGKEDKALEFARKYLEDVEVVKKSIDDAVNLFSEFAARGLAKEALEVLGKSDSAKVLEPLVVGLRLYLGEDVKAAMEIMEVAKDVVKRIEDTHKQIENTKKSEVKK